jgi:TonB family protein
MRLHAFCIAILCSVGVSALAATPSLPDSRYATRGITADGRVVTIGPGKLRPWIIDATNRPAAHLPASERAKHHEGEGFFRLILDPDRGTVRRVILLKSSGYPAIDQTIVDTLRQWKFRPHRWKEFEVYIGLWLNSHGSNHSMERTADRR